MPEHKIPDKGVPDWTKKLALFQALLGAQSKKMLVTKVLRGTKYENDIGYIASTLLGKWKTSRPTQDAGQFFFDTLAAKLPTKDTVNSSLLIELTIAKYIDHLPNDEKTHAIIEQQGYSISSVTSRPTSPGALGVVHASRADSSYKILTHDRGPAETIRTGFQKGRIDQRHYYMDPDSAGEWSALVRADAYPTYSDCKTGLDALVKSQQWKESLKCSRPSTVVMLAGGGAPTKDLVFLQSLLQESYIENCVHLYLVDISYFMLEDSRRLILEHARVLGFYSRVEVEVICDDVLKMTAEDCDFHTHGNVIFAITGGTIGNFHEQTFFRSLDGIARFGDLLVVSADTLDDLTTEDINALKNKYNNPDLRRFLRPVVEEVLRVSALKEFIDEALARIDVKLSSSDDGNPSDVPNSCSVIVRLKVNEREVDLVTSTRYRSSDLEAFASAFGWESVYRIGSPLNKHFKQFLFRRNKPETPGR